MLNRKLQLGFVKVPKASATEGTFTDISEPNYAQIVTETVQVVSQNVVLGMCAYVMLDTLRQVLINVSLPR
jgi:hypothetical protein